METINSYETRLGAHVCEYENKTWRLVIKYILWMILPVIFLVLGVIAIISPEMIDIDPDEGFLVYLFLGAGILSAFFVFRLLSHYTVWLFEHGVVFKRGAKHIELHFNEIEGINFTVNKTSVNFVPLATTKTLSILPRHGRQITISGLKIQNIQGFADDLEDLYTQHVVNGLTRENINEKTIRFGKRLILENGNFIYRDKKKYPLNDILGINANAGVIYFEGKNIKGRKTNLLVVPIGKSYNFNILLYVIYQLREKGMTTYNA